MTAPPAGALEACLALLIEQMDMLHDDFVSYSDGKPTVPFVVLRDALIAALNAYDEARPALLAALRLREWRPVLTMPSDGGTYLVTNQLGEVCPLLDGVIQNNVGRQDWTWGNPIIAWQPLPEPPTADDLARVPEETK